MLIAESARPLDTDAFVNNEPVAKRVTCPTFVGRESELSLLERAALAARLETQLVLIGGDAGVGKTRLIDELSQRLEASGGVVAAGGCVDLADVGIGYGPLLEVLRRLRATIGLEDFDGLLADVAPELGPLLTGGRDRRDVHPGAVLEQTVALFEALGEQSPGLLVAIEDLHWADSSTRDLVAFLARHLRRARVVLVISYRADDIHRRHPVRPLLSELTRNPAVEHVQLVGMTRSELTMLLAGIAGRVPADSIVDDVLARSEGNPFYAEELLAVRSGTGALPESLRAAILARVARLAASVQDVLREAALVGDTVDDRVLSAVGGRPMSEVGEALREAVAHQILVLERDGCRFRHALVRETVYDELLPGERQRLHEATAATLAAHPELVGGPEHVRWALLAYHCGAADDRPQAFAASVRAGLTAQQVGALADAADHFERALGLWPSIAEAEALAGVDHPGLLLHAAAAWDGHGSPTRAVALAESAVALLGSDAEPERRAEALERLGHHRWAAGDQPGSGVARREAAALVTDRAPSEVQAMALVALGRQLMVEQRYLDAEPALRRAMTAAEAADAPGVRAIALGAMGVVLSNLGRADDGLACAAQALDIAGRHGTADQISHVYVNAIATNLIASHHDNAVRLAVAGLEHARRVGTLTSDGALMAGNAATALVLLGRWDEALETVHPNRSAIDGVFGLDAAIVAARIALWRGRIDEAIGQAGRAVAAADEASDFEAFICAAEVEAHRGSFADARRHAATAFEATVNTDDVYSVACICAAAVGIEADRIAAARLGGRRSHDEIDEARAVADELMSRTREMVERVRAASVVILPETAAWLMLAEANHARAHGHADADRWADIADGFDALAFPYCAATARYREADAHLRNRSGHQHAAAAARSALDTAEHLGAAPLAEQLHLLAQRGRLDLTRSPEPAPTVVDPLQALGISPREAEVLRLLSQGRTNRQIGDELYISEKTASVHVTHLLRKLGVANRIEASAIAQRLEPPTGS
jgi:DNA-binding CsgD family transcriptional regulator/tetratricopeptide (TPR) repeat protein